MLSVNLGAWQGYVYNLKAIVGPTVDENQCDP